MSGITASYSGLDKYVVTKVGYQQTVVSMTEHEANVLYNFLEWACIDDEYTVERIEQYDAVEWGIG